MEKHRQAGLAYLMIALAFVVVGLSQEAGGRVVWIILGGVFAVLGATQLRERDR